MAEPQEVRFRPAAQRVLWRASRARMRRGAEEDDADEQALDTIEPSIRDF